MGVRGAQGGVDYIALAARLRGVHQKRSERAEQENPAKLASGGIPLDGVLNALDAVAFAKDVDGQGLQQTLATLTAQTKAQLADATARGGSLLMEDRFLPSDPFERALCRFFADQLETPTPEAMPRAIVSALAKTTDHGGIVSTEKVQSVLGVQATQLLSRLKPSDLASTTSTTTRAKLKHQGLDHLTSQQVARSRSRRTFVERMPLLDEITRHLGGPNALKGLTMVSVQHLFPSTIGLYDALTDNGLHQATTGVGGKNYSSNADAVARLNADGFDVHWLATPAPQDAGLDAEKLVYEMATSQLGRLFHDVDPRTSDRRFLLLDDGGKLIRALHEQFPQYAHLCVAVEQTDRGIQHLEQMAKEGHEVACPVVNMARSVAKKDHEGPMIGESVVFHAEHELKRLSPSLQAAIEQQGKTATIIGYGAVGVATAAALKRRGYDVAIVDTDPDRLEAARRDGHLTPTKDEALGFGALVFGCTGRTVLTPDDFGKLKDGAVLINGASGNHEFGLHAIDKAYFDAADPTLQVGDDGLKRSRFLGQDVICGDVAEGEAIDNRVLRFADDSGKEREVLALRSGYVVNMTLGLPPEYVQLTLGLLLAGCLQAAQETTPGIREIPDDVQAFLVQRTEKHLERLGHDLHAPDFHRLASWDA